MGRDLRASRTAYAGKSAQRTALRGRLAVCQHPRPRTWPRIRPSRRRLTTRNPVCFEEDNMTNPPAWFAAFERGEPAASAAREGEELLIVRAGGGFALFDPARPRRWDHYGPADALATAATLPDLLERVAAWVDPAPKL
jgi:hypothetical protein